jgi:hypothetical protein
MYKAMFVELHYMYNDAVSSSNYTVCTNTVPCPSRYIACAIVFFQCTELCSSGFTIQYILCYAVVGLVWSHDPNSYAGGSVCYW